MQLAIPSDHGKRSSATVPSHPIGTFSRKGADYDAFVVADLAGERAVRDKERRKGKGKRDQDEVEAEEAGTKRDAVHGGQELRSLVPLLPKHASGNKLFVGESLFPTCNIRPDVFALEQPS